MFENEAAEAGATQRYYSAGKRSGSRRRTLWRVLWAPNATLWIVTAATPGFLALSLYSPVLAGVFRFAPLSIRELAVALGPALAAVGGSRLFQRTHDTTKRA